MPPRVYTTTHLKGFLNRGKIDRFLWMMHFPEILDTRVPTCQDCEDFKSGVCPGGQHPIDCFLSKSPEENVVSFGNFSQLKPKQVKRVKQKKADAPDKIDSAFCHPTDCEVNCECKSFGEQDQFHEYDEILQKYSLLHHVEKMEFPEDGFYSIEVFSKRFCPPDRMYDFEDDVMDQIDNFFKEIGMEYEDYGYGMGFFSASASIDTDDDQED